MLGIMFYFMPTYEDKYPTDILILMLQPRELKFGTCITFRVCMKHSAEHFLYQLSSAINSGQQLSKIDKNMNQPRELKFGTCISVSP